jgi:hypothetical protein
MNYYQYVTRIMDDAGLLQADSDPSLTIPKAIEYAENRMFRELDLLVERVTDSTTTLSSGNRNFTLPTATGTFVRVEQVNVITPVAAGSSNGTRNPLTLTSRKFIDAVYSNSTPTTADPVPSFYAMVNNASIIVGPPPNLAYTAEVIGVQYPTALSSANPTTFLSTVLPDVFHAASMVFLSSSPRKEEWEARYKILVQSANVDEVRKKYQSQAWLSQMPAPSAPSVAQKG